MATAIRAEASELLSVILIRFEISDMPKEEARAALQFLTVEAWPKILEHVGLLAARAAGAQGRGLDRAHTALTAREVANA